MITFVYESTRHVIVERGSRKIGISALSLWFLRKGSDEAHHVELDPNTGECYQKPEWVTPGMLRDLWVASERKLENTLVGEVAK